MASLEWTFEPSMQPEWTGNALPKLGRGRCLKMILIDGLFHADPHPGNFFILPGERIAFIDFRHDRTRL